MKSLYLIIDLASVAIPFLVSFHPRLRFYEKWKTLFPALLITGAIFIIWDVLFTKWDVWGFNEDYLLGRNIINLPIEEWLFFVCIPYACVFMHFAIQELLPKAVLSVKITTIITYILLFLFLILSIANYDKLYTQVNYYFAFLVLLISFRFSSQILSKYYVTFLLMLIPFFIVNGILTGSFIHEQVVWYNNDENLGIRLFTIPIEDVTYAFSLILCTLLLMERFSLYKKRHVFAVK